MALDYGRGTPNGIPRSATWGHCAVEARGEALLQRGQDESPLPVDNNVKNVAHAKDDRLPTLDRPVLEEEDEQDATK